MDVVFIVGEVGIDEGVFVWFGLILLVVYGVVVVCVGVGDGGVWLVVW